MTMLLAVLIAAGGMAAVSPPTPVGVATPNKTEVLAAVRAEWPHYDAGNKGRLTPLEFSTWVMRSHGGTVAPRAHTGGIAPVSAMNASATAFARADADHDGGVTPEEMARFLMLPAQPTALTKARAASPVQAGAQ